MTSWIRLAQKISDFAYGYQDTVEGHGLEISPWLPRYDPLKITRIGREQYRELLLRDDTFYQDLSHRYLEDCRRALTRDGWTRTPDNMKWEKDGLSLDFVDALGTEFGERDKNVWLFLCELDERFSLAWEVYLFYSRKDPQGGIDRLERAEETMARRCGA